MGTDWIGLGAKALGLSFLWFYVPVEQYGSTQAVGLIASPPCSVLWYLEFLVLEEYWNI